MRKQKRHSENSSEYATKLDRQDGPVLLISGQLVQAASVDPFTQ